MHKILVIDDEKDILETVSSLIEIKLGCDVDTAANGLDGFLAASNKEYDLIMTDHKMPLMTGAELIVAIRTKENLNKKTPIIMLSGFIDEEMRKSLDLRNVQFITKPFNSDQIFKLISELLI